MIFSNVYSFFINVGIFRLVTKEIFKWNTIDGTRHSRGPITLNLACLCQLDKMTQDINFPMYYQI